MVRRLKKRPFLRKYVLIRLGRIYYWCEERIDQSRVSVVTRRKPVDDVRMMEMGTKLLIEVI